MRKRACISVMAVSLLVSILSVAPASAKSANGLRAQIPFDFNVGGKMMPAGDYVISAMGDDETALRIRGANNRGAVVLTRSAQARAGAEASPRLVFHKYGDQYFLTAVWGDSDTGRALLESKREGRLRRELRVAGNAKTEVVTIAAR